MDLLKGRTLFCLLCQPWEKSRFVLWRTLARRIRVSSSSFVLSLPAKWVPQSSFNELSIVCLSYCWNSWTQTFLPPGNPEMSVNFPMHIIASLCYVIYFFSLLRISISMSGVFYFGVWIEGGFRINLAYDKTHMISYLKNSSLIRDIQVESEVATIEVN